MNVTPFNPLRALWSRMTLMQRDTFEGEAIVTADEMDVAWDDADGLQRLAEAAVKEGAESWDDGPESARMTAAALLARADALRMA